MINLIIILGAVTFALLMATLVMQILFRSRRKKTFYKLHQNFAIATIILAAVHGTAALLYFFNLI